MRYTYLTDIDLSLFDGGATAGGDGAGAAAQAGQADIQGGTQAAPGHTRRGKTSGGDTVLYGKQPAEAGGGDTRGQQQPSDAGREKEPETQTTSNTLEEKRRAYRELVEGEYKDLYTEDTQRLLDKRLRQTRELEERLDDEGHLVHLPAHLLADVE